MSKYLTSGNTARYTKSKQLSDSIYARPTRLIRVNNSSSTPTESADKLQRPVQLFGAVDYTKHDLMQFSAMTDFPVSTNSRKRTGHKVWESCQYTGQDDAGFKQLQHELGAVADSKR